MSPATAAAVVGGLALALGLVFVEASHPVHLGVGAALAEALAVIRTY